MLLLYLALSSRFVFINTIYGRYLPTNAYDDDDDDGDGGDDDDDDDDDIFSYIFIIL